MNETYQIKYLLQELHLLPGYIFSQELKSLKSSIYVLDSNFSELERHIENLKQFKYIGYSKNPNLETKRLAHNYLCSAITLIDHTRIYISNIHKENKSLPHYL